MNEHTTDKRMGFTDHEWNLLVGLPEAIVIAASSVQPDSARRTQAESDAGHEAISVGRESASPLVNAVAVELIARVGDPETGETPDAIHPSDPQATAKDALSRATEAVVLLRGRVDIGEAGAYRHWLVSIADAVITASRSGGALGLGGDQVTEVERQFRDELASALSD